MPGGFITHANWTFGYSIQEMLGGGLRISHAYYGGRKVLHRAELPFVLTNTDGRTTKDGVNPAGGGLPFTPLVPVAPNGPSASLPPGSVATNDSQYDVYANPGGSVAIERLPATPIEPARAVAWAKFVSGDRQYLQRWEFRADGEIHAAVGCGGLRASPARQELNHYLRLDIDPVTVGGADVHPVHRSLDGVEELGAVVRGDGRPAPNARGEGRPIGWQVAGGGTGVAGSRPAYQLRVANPVTDAVWVTQYRGAATEDGSEVELDERALDEYARSAPAAAGDPVLWYRLRQLLSARPTAGGAPGVMPYQSIGFRLVPVDFAEEPVGELYRARLA